MRTLKFIVNGQKIKKDNETDFSGIVKGSKGYLQCHFALSQEWAGCKVAASFWKYDKEIDARLLKNGYCEIPDTVTEYKSFSVSLRGVRPGFQITTDKYTIKQEE